MSFKDTTKNWKTATNNDQLKQVRYAAPADMTDTMNFAKAGADAAWGKNFLNLEKSIDTNNLYLKAFDFHEVRPWGELGIDHFDPQDPRVHLVFGLSTGGGQDPLPVIQHKKRFSCYGA